MRLPLLCEKTGVVAPAQPGLMAGMQADKMVLYLKIIKQYTEQNIRNLVAFRKIQCHYSGTNTF